MTTTPSRGQVTMPPVDVPKASDVLAHQLRERILTGEIAEGAALPPERELVEQTQLSRATVREALRILEVQGLLRIKAGRAGGAFVRRPDPQSVADSVQLLVRGRRIRLDALHQTREAVEPSCAVLAARFRTDEDLEALDEANEAIEEAIDTDDMPAFLSANIRWHVTVARASHNELLSGFMQAISEAIYRATEFEEFVDADVRKIALQAHLNITQAIRDQDPDAAHRRMQRHVHGFASAVLAADPREEIDLVT
jgi:GntR family transcriptional regulator, transcriptional repressor for pyruvate dehydrogenase complex